MVRNACRRRRYGTMLQQPRIDAIPHRKTSTPMRACSLGQRLFHSSNLGTLLPARPFVRTGGRGRAKHSMADLRVELTAPNGRSYIQPLGLFIGNEFVAAKSGDKIKSVNPSNEKEIAAVHAAGAEDVDLAVEAARNAFRDPSWRDLSPTGRGELLMTLAGLIERERETLATIETWDNGKPYRVSLDDDLGEVISTLKYYAGWADKVHGQTFNTKPDKLVYSIHQPVGVCGQIIPWNYPLAMAAWKLGPALACGNTVVLKAAEQTPLSILYLAPLIKEAGFPAGVVNILNGEGRTAGAAIASHTGIDKIAFTGSTATGREIMKMAAINLKDITLETGGKSPLLIFEDADLDQAIKWSHYGIMSNMGQICTATSRIFVHEGIFDRFLDRFKQHIKSVSKLGDPFDEDTFQGPQVSKAQYERVRAYIESGVSEGAAVAFGGLDGAAAKESSAAEEEEEEEEEEEGQTSGKGYFIPPTVFMNVTDSMKIYREEIFGPVAVVSSFGDEDDVIRRANDTIYGLSSAVFTRDLARAHRVARKLESGTVWINSSQDGDIRVPFGGVKQSGIGRELGEAALAAYTSVKAVHVNLENDL